MTEQEKAKWEFRADSVEYKLHKSYGIHNLWARQHNRHDECVYNVEGKEKTLRQIHEREQLDGSQLTIIEVYPDDTIGSADFRDPSPNDVEECRGNYEAELMALPGSNRRSALDGYRNRNE